MVLPDMKTVYSPKSDRLPTPIMPRRSVRLFQRECVRIALMAVVFWIGSSGLYGVAQAVGDQHSGGLSASIVALDHARTTALGELGTSAGAEADDYRDFITYLNTRINTYCQQLQALGADDLLAKLPCPSAAWTKSAEKVSGQPSTLLPVTQTPAPAQTRAEKTAELNDRLLAELGSFDDMLAKEEALVASRVPAQRERGDQVRGEGFASSSARVSSHGTAGETERMSSEGPSTGQEGKTPGEQASAYDGQDIGQGAAADTSSSQGRGGGSAAEQRSSVSGSPDGTLPPPEDDDIVARQLREAAEKETDPELKKKLWEEYWKYKGRRD